MNQTTYDKGIERGMEKGIEKGILQGQRETLLRLGRKKFGAPSRDFETRITSIDDLAKLEILTDRLLDVGSWEQLLELV